METLLDEIHGRKEKRGTEFIPSQNGGKIGMKWKRSISKWEKAKEKEVEKEDKDSSEIEIYYNNLKYILNGWVYLKFTFMFKDNLDS